MLGLRPWLAFLRRALFFFFWVRFDIGGPPYRSGPVRLQPAPTQRVKFDGFCTKTKLRRTLWHANLANRIGCRSAN